MEYYKNLKREGIPRVEILIALHDIAYDLKLLETVREERVTQRSLIDALNEIKSTSDKAIIDKQTPKTLWQRIIDALIKIFGIKFDNIENNTILAREYNLFGNLFNDTIAEIQTVEQQKDTTIETKEESADIITKNQLEDIETDTFSEFEDDVFAVTDKLIESNENITASVNEYLNNYNEQDNRYRLRYNKLVCCGYGRRRANGYSKP